MLGLYSNDNCPNGRKIEVMKHSPEINNSPFISMGVFLQYLGTKEQTTYYSS